MQGSSWTIAAFFVLGISAYHLLRRQDAAVFSRSLRIGLIFAAVGTVFSVVSGHTEAQVAREDQPMKFAAMEAQGETSESPAPWSLLAIIDQEARENTFSLEICYVGSILAYNSLEGRYEGIDQLEEQYDEAYGEGNYVPPVAWVYWSFRVMLAIGSLLLATAFPGLFLWWRRRRDLDGTRWFLRVLVLLIPLPWIANFTGWMVTETRRAGAGDGRRTSPVAAAGPGVPRPRGPRPLTRPVRPRLPRAPRNSVIPNLTPNNFDENRR